MAKKIFIAASGQNIGKTTISISLLHLAQKKYGRVGFIKPLGPKPAVFHGCTVDKDAALIAQVFELEKNQDTSKGYSNSSRLNLIENAEINV